MLKVNKSETHNLNFRNDDATMLATTVRALNTSYFYQLVYNSYSSTITNGTLSFIDISPDRRNANITTNIVRANEMSDTTFVSYGKYFDIDSDGMAFVGAQSGYNTTLASSINTIKLCTHNQKYDSSTKSCLSTSSSSVTFGLQDSTEVTCAGVDDSYTYKRSVAESACNYGCSNSQFGKNCESCSAYMQRLGVSFNMYQKYYYNETSYTWSITDDPEYWSKHTYCLDCFGTKGWVYLNRQWSKGTPFSGLFKPIDYIASCPNNTEWHNKTVCSNSQYNVDTMK